MMGLVVAKRGVRPIFSSARSNLLSTRPTRPAQAKAQAPSILLLDELDALAPARSASHSEHERQATARLLAAVDALRASRARVGLVGATNRREAVDPALRRAGRLDSEVRSVGEGRGRGRGVEKGGKAECCGVMLSEVPAAIASPSSSPNLPRRWRWRPCTPTSGCR